MTMLGAGGWADGCGREHRLEKNQILDCLRMINHGTVACHRIRVMLVGACCRRLLVVVARGGGCSLVSLIQWWVSGGMNERMNG